MNSNDMMLTARQVRARYGNVSDMAIWRWLRDDSLQFPEPIYINGRRYWWLSALEAFDRSRPNKKEAA